MTTNIATTPSQSRRLLECGVDPKTADMSWRTILCLSDNEPWSDPQLLVLPYSVAKDIYHDDYIESAWSLSTLLSLLPKEIDIDGYAYRINIYFENPDEPVIGNQWCLYYKPKKHNEKSRIDDMPMYAPDLIECAVLMIEWLTANNCKLNPAMTTEEKARAYAESRIAVKDVRVMCITPREKRLERFDAYDIEQAYEDGATEALASQWVSVEDRLPKPHEEVLTYTIGAIDENAVAYHDGEDWYTTNGEHIRPHYWLPIPPLKGGDE